MQLFSVKSTRFAVEKTRKPTNNVVKKLISYFVSLYYYVKAYYYVMQQYRWWTVGTLR